MPVFAFKGVDAQGKKVSGNREAENSKTLKTTLRREGVFLTDLKETGSKKGGGAGTGAFAGLSAWLKTVTAERVSTEDLAMSTRQLATLLGAGIALVESLTALVDQIENVALKNTWSSIKKDVNEGASLGDALAKHSRIFSPLYINLVRAGESSGAMDVVLERLADFTESQAALRSKVASMMMYPVLMLFMAVAVVVLLFVLVIPKITKIFESQKMALPLPTQVLISTSDFVGAYWWLLLILGAVSIWAFIRYINTDKGRMRWDNFKLTAPVFGTLTRKIAIARFCRTLSTLLSSGVPLLTAFDIVKNVIQNRILMDVVDEVRNCVKEGDSIAGPLKRSGHFPPIVTHMIGIGEKSGQLEQMLTNVSNSYDTQVDNTMRGLTSLMEPLILVIMGIVIACIVFAILMPILQMSSSI
ncbi:MAG: type II secretion system inner membrane protein GspF [Myxococcota bacterium]|nr:type II secretion system inner membrane protein GspF [Myxococcota bacterium]